MRYKTRVDTWLVIVLVAAAAVSVGFPSFIFLRSLIRGGPLPWPLLLAIPVWIIVLAATIPQHYELGADGLYIRQGWHRILLEYETLESAFAVDSLLSAGVFSGRRVQIETRAGGAYLIAPRDRPGFLEELRKRAPQTKSPY